MFGPTLVLQLVNIIFGFIEGILAVRVLLRFFGASSGAPFVRWVYETSDPLLTPFRGMFPNSILTGGYVLEVNTLIAILIYAIAGYILGEIIAYVRYFSLRSYRKVDHS